jgi:NAD(P)-dependent dehydrogenase (short-subunit alcohol dehydrogenase family)
MAGWFTGKVALVTGASSGIGRASALAFAREGAKVVVADRVVEGGEETVSLIKSAGFQPANKPTRTSTLRFFVQALRREQL